MPTQYESIVATAETPLLKKDEGSLSKRKFSLGFVGALLVTAVLGTFAVQHIVVPRQASLSEASSGFWSATTPGLHADVGGNPPAIASGDGEPASEPTGAPPGDRPQRPDRRSDNSPDTDLGEPASEPTAAPPGSRPHRRDRRSENSTDTRSPAPTGAPPGAGFEHFSTESVVPFEEDDEEEAPSGLLAGLASSITSAASLGGCRDKKVSGCVVHKKKKCRWLWYDNGCDICHAGYNKQSNWECRKCGDRRVANCAIHQKSACGGLWYDNGKCQTCHGGYNKESDTNCKKCDGDKKVANCAIHQKSACGGLWYDNGKCQTCHMNYYKESATNCKKCEGDKKVANCALHKKSFCGGLWYDNGKCQTCRPDYAMKSETNCEKCSDKNVDGCLIPEKDMCGSPPVLGYDNGKCHTCTPGCKKSNDKKSCNCKFWEDQWDAVKEDPLSFAKDSLDGIGDAVDEMNAHVSDTIAGLQTFFNGLQCDVNVDVLKELFVTFADNVSPDFSNILKVFQGKQDDFVKGLGGPLCEYIWKTALPDASVVLAAVNAVVQMVDKHCPALKIDTGSKVPTVTLGFTVDANVDVGAHYAAAGAEIGLGFTLRGDKICYVGACAEQGIKLQAVPDFPFGVGAGIAVTLFDHLGNVPGQSATITLGAGVDIPPPAAFGAGVQGDFSATMVSSGGKLIGVSVGLGLDPSASPPDVELSFAQGTCLTPVCVTTEGENCNPDYTPADGGKEVAEIFSAGAGAE